MLGSPAGVSIELLTPTQHFDFHHTQLTLEQQTPPG